MFTVLKCGTANEVGDIAHFTLRTIPNHCTIETGTHASTDMSPRHSLKRLQRDIVQHLGAISDTVSSFTSLIKHVFEERNTK